MKKINKNFDVVISSVIFGLFFGAGNIIFPIHLGQTASENMWIQIIGFIVSAVGLPFLGLIAIAVSGQKNISEIASKVHPIFGKIFSFLLYFVAAFLFAIPRTAAVPFEIAFTPYIQNVTEGRIYLAIFTFIFFLTCYLMSVTKKSILNLLGKIINPIFLILIIILVLFILLDIKNYPLATSFNSNNLTQSFSEGFSEGYNTMDALGALVFGTVVVKLINENKKNDELETRNIIKYSGVLSILVMALLYFFLIICGNMSLRYMPVSDNGGIALQQMTSIYFGEFGFILLSFLVIFACLKTAVGLLIGCANACHSLYPKYSFKVYVGVFSIVCCLIANFGLTDIIKYSIPILTILYPVVISLIAVVLLSKYFYDNVLVYRVTILTTIICLIINQLSLLPTQFQKLAIINKFILFDEMYIPMSSSGLGWFYPTTISLIVSIMFVRFQTKKETK